VRVRRVLDMEGGGGPLHQNLEGKGGVKLVKN